MSGVTVHDRARATPGFNLVASGHDSEAWLMDMDGRVLHRWAYDFWEVWPDFDVFARHSGSTYWRRVHLFDNGDLLAIHEGLGIIKLDRESTLLWATPCRAHHDLEVLDDGRILTLTRHARLVPWIDPDTPVLDEYVAVLDAGGTVVREVSLLDAAARSSAAIGAEVRAARHRREGDLLHTNTVQMLRGRAAGAVAELTAGRVLVGSRHLSAVMVLDLDREELVWFRRGPFHFQHDTRILDDGTMLLLDNRHDRGVSAAEILDPATMAPLWTYAGTADRPLYTHNCGAVHRLPSGNVLISESDNGRALEVTPGGEVVWEYYNPRRAGRKDEFIATILDVVRLPEEFPVGWADPDVVPCRSR